MKRYCLGAAVFAAISMPACAQSSVTLYGMIDLGVAYVSKLGGASAVKMLDATSVPTMWGLTGAEDLGGGTRAVFKLENGFLASTGAQINPNSFFNRQAYVGLANRDYGTLTMGHQASLEFEMISPLYAAGWTLGTDLMYHPGNIDDLFNSHQIDSSLKYRSPVFKGFEIGLLFGGLTGVAGDPAYARAYQAAATYKIGDFAASAFYGSENHRAIMMLSGTGLITLFGQRLSAAPFVADNVKNVAVGLRYAPAPYVFTALFTQSRIGYQGQTSNMNNYDLAASWRVTAALMLGAGYTQTHFVGNVTNTGSVTVNYELSKRTGVYANEVFQRASSGHVADISTIGPAGCRSQNVVMVGMRHRF
ncbi:porin [Paraburkholderia sp. J63]|uniref:porin n=1 Tax=Paraburkholderia sp. J63 TaxID=2805434 RepID=UPI002ABE0FCE|nr:porin [Paraburkholderia sp. J63]